MELDFTKVTVRDLGGNEVTLPLANRKIANDWYFGATDIKELDMARSMYERGVVEVDAANAPLLKNFLRKSFTLPVQMAFLEKIDCLLNAKEGVK